MNKRISSTLWGDSYHPSLTLPCETAPWQQTDVSGKHGETCSHWGCRVLTSYPWAPSEPRGFKASVFLRTNFICYSPLDYHGYPRNPVRRWCSAFNRMLAPLQTKAAFQTLDLIHSQVPEPGQRGVLAADPQTVMDNKEHHRTTMLIRKVNNTEWSNLTNHHKLSQCTVMK